MTSSPKAELSRVMKGFVTHFGKSRILKLTGHIPCSIEGRL